MARMTTGSPVTEHSPLHIVVTANGFVLSAPERAGNRTSTRHLLTGLPEDLTGKRVTVDVEDCLATTSFAHEVMLEVVARRNADRLTFEGASDTFAELAYFCAKDDDVLTKRVWLGDVPVAAPDASEITDDDILVLLDRWLTDDEFCESTNTVTFIAGAAAEIERLREAGDRLVGRMRSGSGAGWDDAIDAWDNLR